MADYTKAPSKTEDAVASVKHVLGMDKSKPAQNADTGDSEEGAGLEGHAQSILSGIRGFIDHATSTKKSTSGRSPTQGGRTVDDVVSEAVTGTPGNSADY